jgi:hypothetical protein
VRYPLRFGKIELGLLALLDIEVDPDRVEDLAVAVTKGSNPRDGRLDVPPHADLQAFQAIPGSVAGTEIR